LLADRDKLPHADLSRTLTAPVHFRVKITKRVKPDSTPLTARYRPVRGALTPGVQAGRVDVA